MKALVNVASLDAGTDPDLVSKNRGAFSIPMANIYGECNNAHAGRFMESQSTECSQVIDIDSACVGGALDPTYYTSRLEL